jgi:uncharacterized membrane protein YdbT with pleckstrin-like domain
LGYVEQNLNPGERILYATHLHWLVLIRSILVDLIFSLAGLALIIWGFAGTHSQRGEAQAAEIAGTVLIAIGTFIFAIAAVRRNATEMAVTNKRVIIKVGFMTKRTIELFLSKVESVGVEQSMFGRMMGYGSITVRGTGGTNEPFDHVANPLEFRRQVQRQIEEHINPSPESQY